VAALAYVFPPISGLIAYLRGRTPRMRFHGLQAVLLGLVWPASLYLCSMISPGATQIAFVVMAALWLIAIVGALLGRDPGIPGIRGLLANAAATSPVR
jgi:uncharacterized membrane protein